MNFEWIFLEFLRMDLQINRLKDFSNRTDRKILPSNRIEFRIERPKFFEFFQLIYKIFKPNSNQIVYFDFGQPQMKCRWTRLLIMHFKRSWRSQSACSFWLFFSFFFCAFAKCPKIFFLTISHPLGPLGPLVGPLGLKGK